MKSIIKNVLISINKETSQYEFKKIKINIKNYVKDNKFLIADIGSGLCEFALDVSELNNKSNIYCMDINKDLVELAKNYGFNAKEGQIIKLPYKDNYFDVVHCSHVIEHLSYPDIIHALDELMRITKLNGLIIIRSPLWINHRFYNDIDHVRPYPPQAILNYFNNAQQQKVGKYKVEEIDRWYTQIYYEIDPNRFPYKIIKYINILLKLLWRYIKVPFARPNNYGIVIRKQND